MSTPTTATLCDQRDGTESMPTTRTASKMKTQQRNQNCANSDDLQANVSRISPRLSEKVAESRDVPLQELAGTVDLHDQVPAEMEAEERNAAEVPMTESNVALARAEQYDAREYMYGNGAMEVAYGMGIFEREDGEALGGGHCDRASFEDMAILRTLLVTHPSCAAVDTHTHPWDSASLVTPRHAARVRWNTAALIKHCKRTGNRMYVSQAEDTDLEEEDRRLHEPTLQTKITYP
ncbi:hypothetical protein C8R46DRAFT_1030554 [Mycena filopes]|nr:hypothetical protein C8R46DRAFT_1030554 [Mycena filopes]